MHPIDRALFILASAAGIAICIATWLLTLGVAAVHPHATAVYALAAIAAGAALIGIAWLGIARRAGIPRAWIAAVGCFAVPLAIATAATHDDAGWLVLAAIGAFALGHACVRELTSTRVFAIVTLVLLVGTCAIPGPGGGVLALAALHAFAVTALSLPVSLLGLATNLRRSAPTPSACSRS